MISSFLSSYAVQKYSKPVAYNLPFSEVHFSPEQHTDVIYDPRFCQVTAHKSVVRKIQNEKSKIPAIPREILNFLMPPVTLNPPFWIFQSWRWSVLDCPYRRDWNSLIAKNNNRVQLPIGKTTQVSLVPRARFRREREANTSESAYVTHRLLRIRLSVLISALCIFAPLNSIISRVGRTALRPAWRRLFFSPFRAVYEFERSYGRFSTSPFSHLPHLTRLAPEISPLYLSARRILDKLYATHLWLWLWLGHSKRLFWSRFFHFLRVLRLVSFDFQTCVGWSFSISAKRYNVVLIVNTSHIQYLRVSYWIHVVNFERRFV